MLEKMRTLLQRYLEQVVLLLVRPLARYGLSPNQISFIGFFITLISSGILLFGYPGAAGIVFLLGSVFDMIDGALARLEKQTTALGAFLDSTLDRVGEGTLFTALAYRLALEGEAMAVAGVALAMLGGMLTSYIRARAEALGIACAVGWITRPERVILLGVGLSSGLLAETVYLLALLTLWTSGQRIVYVYSALRSHD